MKAVFILSQVVAWLALGFWSGLAMGQANTDEAEQVVDAAPIQSEPAPAPPGEEVMRPTQRGIRLTRRMADGIGRTVVREQLTKDWSIDDDRKEKLARLVSDRAWDMKMRYSKEGSVAIESFYEMLLSQEAGGETRLTPEKAREFSRKVGPGTRLVREFWEGLLDDADPLLNDEEYADLEEKADKALRMTKRFDEKMDRWSRGEVEENERLLQGIEEDTEAAEVRGKTTEYVKAERSVRWRINSLGPETWRRFLDQAANVLSFDEVQKKDGEAILREYREQVETIMTKEWKAEVMANRVQEHLQRLAPEEPLEPWVFRLNMEYKRMVEPVQELGREFRREIIALADPDQLEQMFVDLRKIGNEHGMTPEELAGVASLVPQVQTQPEAD